MPAWIRADERHTATEDGGRWDNTLGSLRKATKAVAEYHFLQAPHVIPECEHGKANCDGERFGWLSYSGDRVEGLDASIEVVRQELLAQGDRPYDGIMGFSQGAALAAYLSLPWFADSVSTEHQRQLLTFRFAALFSGRMPPAHKWPSDRTFSALPTTPTGRMPTFLCLGIEDEIVPAQDSLALAKTLDPTLADRLGEGVGDVGEGHVIASASTVVVWHPGGHMVPAKGVAKKEFKDFMVQQHGLLLQK